MIDMFNYERRLDLQREAEKIHKYLLSDVYFQYYGNKNFYESVDRVFVEYKYRVTANTITEYLNDVDIPFSTENEKLPPWNYDQCLLYMQFIANLLLWMKIDSEDMHSSLELETVKVTNKFNPMMANIKHVLEKSNYNMIIQRDRVVFLKRDFSTDSILNVINDKSIATDLLSYLDIRTQTNLIEKKSIIMRLYKYLEIPENSHFKDFTLKLNSKSPDIKLLSDFNCICDNFDIRHFPDTMHKITGLRTLNETDTKELCDIAYYLFLEMFRIPTISNYANTVSAYKSKYLIQEKK